MLVNYILDLSKIEAGQLDLEKLDFNPAELVDEITDTMRVLAENKGLKLHSTLAPDSQCMVNGDSGRLTQILANLISNAIKFTGSGEVNVYLHISDLNAEEKMLQFKVTDTGIGLSPDKQQNIFAAFAQTDNAMARNRAGSGLRRRNASSRWCSRTTRSIRT